ncbi:MAG: M48 family metallopeptidase [Solirubrobacteraceae bacterium]
MESPSRIRAATPLLLAAATAEGAARLLMPPGYARRTSAVDPNDYFSKAEIKRGARYSRPQVMLGLARAGIEVGLLVALVRHARQRAPEASQRSFADSENTADTASAPSGESTVRVAAEGAVVGAGIALAASLAPLPLSAIARRRSIKVGLATQSWRGWASDLVKSSAIEAAFAGVTSAGVVALTRRYPRGWWAPAAGGSVAFGAGLAALAPVLLDPVFNDFTPLPEGPVRSDVLELARRAGVKVREAYSVDASRRTTAANAYVTGLGPTKRVVLFDTLLDRYDRDEVAVVVAHELGHVKHRDVARSVAYAAVVAGPSALAIQRLSWALAPGLDGTASALPALGLATGIVSAPLGLIASRLSRAIERRADDFSLNLSGAASAFVSFERKISLQNVADVRPPRLLSRIAASHPPTVERIGAALAYERR